MPIITSLEIENFRAIKDKFKFEFKPLTILTGTNSSGKSSLIKALLLMENNFSHFSDILNLNFTKDRHALGNFQKTLNHKAENKNISFGLPFKMPGNSDKCTLTLSYKLNQNNELGDGILSSMEIKLDYSNEVIARFDFGEKMIVDIDSKYFLEKFKEILYKANVLRETNTFNKELSKFYQKNIDFGDTFNQLDSKDKTEKKELENWNKPKKEDTPKKFSIEEIQKVASKFQKTFGIKQRTKEELIHFFNNYNATILGHLNDDGSASRSEENFVYAGTHEGNLEEKRTQSGTYKYFYSFDKLNSLLRYNEDQIENTYGYFLDKKKNHVPKNSDDSELDDLEWDKLEAFLCSDDYLKNFVLSGIKIEDENNELYQLQKEFINLLNVITDSRTNFSVLTDSETYSSVHPIIVRNPKDDKNEKYNFASLFGSATENYSEFRNRFFELSGNFSRTGITQLKSILNLRPNDFPLIKAMDEREVKWTHHLFEDFTCNFFDYIMKYLEYSLSISIKDGFNINLIGVERNEVKRIYQAQNKQSEFELILVEFLKLGLKENSREIKFLKSAVVKLQIADNIKIEQNEEGFGTIPYLIKNGQKILLADVGYGVSQILPVLLKILITVKKKSQSSQSKSTLIIEEPETNLHPALQSRLADIFVDAYKKFGLQFIIETHSEYFIRKLQFLIAKLDFKSKDAVIYYFHSPDKIPEGEEHIKKISISDDGVLSDNFGPGFFDEADNLAMSLFAMNKSRKN